MRLKQLVVIIMIVLIAAPSSWAQPPAADANVWRTFSEQLEPNALVKVRMKNGKSVKGHIVLVGAEALQVNPRTRVASPLRELAFSDIAAIDQLKEPRWNPAAKTLLGVGIAFGTLMLFTLLAFAAGYD
jgi:hypothetical protein